MRRSAELWMAGLTILSVGLGYLGIVRAFGTPRASGLVGHGLGVLGFLLMLATESLYSLRKRALRRPWGRMSSWLQFHIYTGIVGPFLVLLHTAWTFRGLAAVLTLMMGLVVLSGFIGRYIYTAVPRTADGLTLEMETLESQLASASRELALHVEGGPGRVAAMAARPASTGWGAVLWRGVDSLSYRLRTWWELRGVDSGDRERMAAIRDLGRKRLELQQQMASLAAARSLLSLWHTIHIPLGVVLFAMAFFHIGAALYYATLSP
jgi:hypothetical protein